MLIDQEMEAKQLKLYPSSAPGSEHLKIEEECFEERMPEGDMKLIVRNITVPTIQPFLPESETENKERIPKRAAVLVIPGGAYRRLVVNFEGIDIAKWLNKQGIAAFVLKCRLPVNEHENKNDVALMDAQRAIRLIRSNAKEWNLDENRIGVMGFSAGGSIASMLSTCFSKEVYEPVDEADQVSARPDFCILGYPAISVEVDIQSRLSRALGKHVSDLPIIRQEDAQGNITFQVGGMQFDSQKMEQYHIPSYLFDVLTKYSTDLMVTSQTPPTFLMETDEDTTTPSEHSIRYYLACRRENVPAELHIFQKGAHGFGLGADSDADETGQWKTLFLKWAKVQNII